MGQMVRASGKIVPGSVARDGLTLSFEFEQDDGGRIAARYRKLLPLSLPEGAEVSLEGSLSADGVIEATKLDYPV